MESVLTGLPVLKSGGGTDRPGLRRVFLEGIPGNYIRREDILAMAELGYNSVRIPFSYRLFMEDGPGIHWKEEGFVLLDRCLSWCEEAGMYAFWICMEHPVDKPGRISMTLWITFPDCS